MTPETKTILVAKVVGPDGSDDALSHSVFSDRIKKIDEIITAHHGKLVGGVDDGVIAEFSDANDAVHCALDISRQFGVDGDGETIRIGIEVAIDGEAAKRAISLVNRLTDSGTCISANVQALVSDQEHFTVTLLEASEEPDSTAYRVETTPHAPPHKHRSVPWRSAVFATGLAVSLIIVAMTTWQGPFGYVLDFPEPSNSGGQSVDSAESEPRLETATGSRNSPPIHEFDGRWEIVVNSREGCRDNEAKAYPVLVQLGQINEPTHRVPKKGTITSGGHLQINLFGSQGETISTVEAIIKGDLGRGRMSGITTRCTGDVIVRRLN